MLGQAKSKAASLGVLSVNIDQFKGINDAFGHAVGDAVLKVTARRLQRLLPPGAILARPHGDSFIMLVPGHQSEGAADLAADVIAALAEPIDLDGTHVFATASVGFAIGPRDGETGDELLRRTDLAVDKAKASASETAIAFVPEMDTEVSYRRALESALRAAVAEGHYRRRLSAARWIPAAPACLASRRLPAGTMPSWAPSRRKSSSRWPRRRGSSRTSASSSCAAPSRTARRGADVNVAVNVSALQIHHGDIVEVVRDVLRESRFPADRLEIEITESVLLADEKRANEQMRGLQALGVKVALDDFGTGYSSLQYLRRFGFDKLKIDRSFIDGAGSPQDSSVILASIIRLGHDLNLTITAEGVETMEQQRWLQGSGCHQLQGYLFSRPLTAGQMSQFIADHSPKAAATG